MAGLKDYQISVYVANLGKYVEGVLQGAWITLPMPAERLQDTLKTEVGLGGRTTTRTCTRRCGWSATILTRPRAPRCSTRTSR